VRDEALHDSPPRVCSQRGVSRSADERVNATPAERERIVSEQ